MRMRAEPLPNSTCGACGVTGRISRVGKSEVETIRGRSYEVDKVVRHCDACGQDGENSLDEDWRPEAFARYRADLGMVTPERMVQFRRAYDLRQEEVTALLGWGDATLGRYERGSLQSAAHDNSLATLMVPGGLIDAIESKADALSPERKSDLLRRLREEGALLSPEEIKTVRVQRGLTLEEADLLVAGRGRWPAWEAGTGLQHACADRLMRLMGDRPDIVPMLRNMNPASQAATAAPQSVVGAPLKLSHPMIRSFREEVSSVGLREDAVRKLLSPWWNSAEEAESKMISARVLVTTRFGMALDNHGRLCHGVLPEARFKTISGTSASDVTAARAVATAVARLVAKAIPNEWKGSLPDVARLREQIIDRNTRKWVDFESLAGAAWDLGIPIIFLPQPPVLGKKMDGMATFVDGRPVIVLCRNQKFSDRMLFVLAHELGHVARRHLPESDGAAVLDERVRELSDGVDLATESSPDLCEAEADAFAQNLLVADGMTLTIQDTILPAPTLASEAIAFGEEHGISPGHVVLNAIRHTTNPPFDLNPLGTATIKIIDDILMRSVTQDICKSLTRRSLTFSSFSSDEILFLEKIGVI